MFRNLFGKLEALWRQIEQAGTVDERTVLVVTTYSSVQLDLRILSIQERWRILYARSLEAALQITHGRKVAVVIYDRDLPDVEWCGGLRALVNRGPVFFILLSPQVDRCLWKTVLDNGGYDVARRPVDREKLVHLVNGAFALANCVDSVLVLSGGR